MVGVPSVRWGGTGADLRKQTSQLAILALGLVVGSGAAQNARTNATNEDSATSVHLEPHQGITQFKLGDPVMLDLVFSSREPGYVVNTDPNPYRPVPDIVDVAPSGGWVRTHKTLLGQGQDLSMLANLDKDSVRVPVLLNRTITFQAPGHYEVTLTTERLRSSATSTNTTAAEGCDRCRTTNAVGIDLSAADEREEPALVVSLSIKLEDTSGRALGSEMSAEQKEVLHQEMENQRRTMDASEAGKKQAEALLRKMNELIAKQVSLLQKREDARRDAAVRLAYLPGDDAVRAKVHFIVADREEGDATPISPIMLDGLPSSRNKRLQLDLLATAWRNPQHIPTDILQTALREGKELLHTQMVTDEATLWAGTSEEHQAALEEYQGEINEIAATLPLRTEPNRAETLKFLKSRVVPNRFQ
jgi:hypothetical protein